MNLQQKNIWYYEQNEFFYGRYSPFLVDILMDNSFLLFFPSSLALGNAATHSASYV